MINIYHKNNALVGWVDMEKSTVDPFAGQEGVSMFTKDVSLATDETLTNFNFAKKTADVFKVPPAPPAPTPVPSEITMRQCRLQLLASKLLDQVNAAINTLPSPQKEAAQIEWEYSAVVKRNSALLADLAPALKLDSKALDTLFIEAAKL
jgi:hypothetical protein